MAYSNDGYKEKSKFQNKFKKGSNALDLSGEESVDLMLKK